MSIVLILLLLSERFRYAGSHALARMIASPNGLHAVDVRAQYCAAALTCAATLPQPAAAQAAAPLVDTIRTLLSQHEEMRSHELISVACAIVAAFGDVPAGKLMRKLCRRRAHRVPGTRPRLSMLSPAAPASSAWRSWQSVLASSARLLSYVLARWSAQLERQHQQQQVVLGSASTAARQADVAVSHGVCRFLLLWNALADKLCTMS